MPQEYPSAPRRSPHTLRGGAPPGVQGTAAPGAGDGAQLREQLERRLAAELREQQSLRVTLQDLRERRLGGDAPDAGWYGPLGFDDDFGGQGNLPPSYSDTHDLRYADMPRDAFPDPAGVGAAGLEGDEAPEPPTTTARCLYYDQGRCKNGDGCRFYHPGRFRRALTDPGLDHVPDSVAAAVLCAQSVADTTGMVVLKAMRDLFLEDINEVGYTSPDAVDEAMALAVGVPVAYEVPWYRTVPLRPFLQLTLLRLRGAGPAALLRHCVVGKGVEMVAIHSSQLSMMMADGVKWVISPARAPSGDLGRRVPSWRFGTDVLTLGVDYSLVAPCMARTYCHRLILDIPDPGEDATSYRIAFADERPLGLWTLRRARRLRRLSPFLMHSVVAFLSPPEEAVVEVLEAGHPARTLQSEVYLHPHI